MQGELCGAAHRNQVCGRSANSIRRCGVRTSPRRHGRPRVDRTHGFLAHGAERGAVSGAVTSGGAWADTWPGTSIIRERCADEANCRRHITMTTAVVEMNSSHGPANHPRWPSAKKKARWPRLKFCPADSNSL